MIDPDEFISANSARLALVINLSGGKDSTRMLGYWNVSDRGDVCLGSARVPGEVTIASLQGWEEGFFQSEFTHPNAVKRLTEHPGGFIGLWTALIGKRSFPAEYLADAGETLDQFLQR